MKKAKSVEDEHLAILRDDLNTLRKQIDKIETKRVVERNKQLVGKTFRYRKSSGLGSKWWLYAKVVRIDERAIYCFTFEEVSNGEIRVQPDTYYYNYLINGYEPCSVNDYKRAWAAIARKIAKVQP